MDGGLRRDSQCLQQDMHPRTHLGARNQKQIESFVLRTPPMNKLFPFKSPRNHNVYHYWDEEAIYILSICIVGEYTNDPNLRSLMFVELAV